MLSSMKGYKTYKFWTRWIWLKYSLSIWLKKFESRVLNYEDMGSISAVQSKGMNLYQTYTIIFGKSYLMA